MSVPNSPPVSTASIKTHRVFMFWFFYGIGGFVIFAIIIIFTLAWIWYIKKKIGGMTGDTLGAINKITEMVFRPGHSPGE